LRKLIIIECPSNLGLKAPAKGKVPGVWRLPEVMSENGFHKKIAPDEVHTIIAPAYTPEKDRATGLLNCRSLVHYAKLQASLIAPIFAQKHLPLVIGGDCSILLGVALALRKAGNYALFYLDGHTDFMDVRLSETGGMGGMAAYVATGNGYEGLSNIDGHSSYVSEENLWCVGNREYDDEYENQIRGSNATYISLSKLRSAGIERCASAFLKMIENKNLDGFFLHIDVDVLNDNIMPCVDSRNADGLYYPEFNKLCGMLFSSKKFAGVEITILDPDLDTGAVFTNLFIENFTRTFNAATQQTT